MNGIIRWLAGVALILAPIFVALLVLPVQPVLRLAPGESLEISDRLDFLFIDHSQEPPALRAASPDAPDPDARYFSFDAEGAARIAEVAEVSGRGVTLSGVRVGAEPVDISWDGPDKTKFTAPGLRFQVHCNAAAPAETARTYAYVDFRLGDLGELLPNGKALRVYPRPRGENGHAIRVVELHPSKADKLAAAAGVSALIALVFALPAHGIWLLVSGSRENKRAETLALGAPNEFPRFFPPAPGYPKLLTGSFQFAFGLIAALFGAIVLLDTRGDFPSWVMGLLAAMVVVATACAALLAGRLARGVRVGPDGIELTGGNAKGNTTSIPWDAVSSVVERSRTTRGVTATWLVIQTGDKRHRIHQGQTCGYPQLKELICGAIAARDGKSPAAG